MLRYLVISNNNGVLSIVTLKDWARGNQHLFPGYNFMDNVPTTHAIEMVLHNRGFTGRMEDESLVIRYNLTQIP